MGDCGTLNDILKGRSDPSSPRHVTDAARQLLFQVEHAIQHQQVCYVDYVTMGNLCASYTIYSKSCAVVKWAIVMVAFTCLLGLSIKFLL